MNLIASQFAILILVVVFVLMGFKVLREYERAVIFRWGRLARGLIGGNGPGVVLIIPFIDKMVRVSLRTVTMDVPPQDVITKDNVSVKVNAVIYFRVVDQERAIIQVEDYLYATSMMAQTTLRSVLGRANSTTCCRNGNRSTAISNGSSTNRRSHGASKSTPWK